MKLRTYYINTADEIIDIVKSNPFNKGIILGGLEWTLQPKEAKAIIERALSNDLEVILYTGLKETDFSIKFKQIYNLPIYIKFERYNENLKDNNHYSHGVKLASSNQYIKRCGGKD